MKTQLRNARLILPDAIIPTGSVLLEADKILSLSADVTPAGDDAEVHDLTGYTLMPGMVDLHCDAIEKEVEPRSGVFFPMDFACAQVDKRNAAAGITTVFHSLSFADEELGVRCNETAADLARAIAAYAPHALIDNRVHCRYEITDESGLAILQQLLEEEVMTLVSMMDHTPGQGQFKDVAAYQAYFQNNYKRSAEDIAQMIGHKQSQSQAARERMQTLIEASVKAGIAVASHDDDCLERVALVSELGATISEFPITPEAATAAKAAGMHTVFGAPNILRGKSQSGSMRAIEAIERNVADCLCADYSPATMLAAAFRVPEISDLDLPAAVRLVTANPALAAGLTDRGQLAEGQRADLIAVQTVGDLPQVARVWSAGKLVYQAGY